MYDERLDDKMGGNTQDSLWSTEKLGYVELNKKLSAFTDNGREHLYASARNNNRIQLDGYFKPEEIIEIAEIIKTST